MTARGNERKSIYFSKRDFELFGSIESSLKNDKGHKREPDNEERKRKDIFDFVLIQGLTPVSLSTSNGIL